MTPEIALTLFVLLSAIIAMMLVRVSPDVILFAALSVLMLAGIVDPGEAFKEGFGNKALVTIGALFIVAEGIRQTGGIQTLVLWALGKPRNTQAAQIRLMGFSAVMSAFINNTPVVAILLPIIGDWAKKHQISVSRLLMPLSYATILGGMCTLIGTSTTLILNEMLNDLEGDYGLGLFEVAYVAFPVTLFGIAYVVITSKWLLPERLPAIKQMEDPREYMVEMTVDAGSSLIGKTIEQAGLRHLPGVYLMEIDRQGDVIAAVSPQERVQAEDRLIFVGVVESVVDLQKISGLKPATDQVFKLESPRSQRCLIEAVVSNTCPILGMTIREAKFRTRYNAAVIAVSRNGERVTGKIGDIQLNQGDTLLLEAHPSFADFQRNSRDFYLVSTVDDSTPPRHEKARLALGLLAAMIVMALTPLGMLKAALTTCILMILTGCVSVPESKRAIDLSVLFTIGAGLAMGVALESSGTHTYIAENLIGLAGNRPHTVLAVIYLITMILTNLITAKAAAVLIFPIAVATSFNLGIADPTPFVVAVMIAAAASFATPISFQTNLMVFGPGGYRYSDFVRVGGPLSILIWAICILLIPLIWPFEFVANMKL